MTDDNGLENGINPTELDPDNPDPSILGDDADRPMPRKVELDIEELAEDIIVEQPAAVEEEIDPIEDDYEDEEEDLEVKASPLKLIAFILAGVGVLAVIVIGIVFFINYNQALKDIRIKREALTSEKALNINMQPFVLNYQDQGQERLIRVVIRLSFTNSMATLEFKEQQTLLRDLIFRFLQGGEPEYLENKDNTVDLEIKLSEIVNSFLIQGKLARLSIKNISDV